MAEYSRSGPGEGVSHPEEIITEEHESFEKDCLFVGWSGNGYTEDTCWILADLNNVCRLSYWE